MSAGWRKKQDLANASDVVEKSEPQAFCPSPDHELFDGKPQNEKPQNDMPESPLPIPPAIQDEKNTGLDTNHTIIKLESAGG